MPTEIKTIQGNASEYKKCKNAGGGYFPFGDKTALRVFDERVKNEYVDTLRKMCRFVDDFIDAGGDIKKDELLHLSFLLPSAYDSIHSFRCSLRFRVQTEVHLFSAVVSS